jgi:hypothetical protein
VCPSLGKGKGVRFAAHFVVLGLCEKKLKEFSSVMSGSAMSGVAAKMRLRGLHSGTESNVDG